MFAVKIAYNQGILKGTRLTGIQRWALARFIVDERNQSIKDDNERLKFMTRVQNPDLYFQVWPAEETDLYAYDEDGQSVDIQGDIVPDMSPDEIMDYFATDRSNSTLEDVANNYDEERFGNWQ